MTVVRTAESYIEELDGLEYMGNPPVVLQAILARVATEPDMSGDMDALAAKIDHEVQGLKLTEHSVYGAARKAIAEIKRHRVARQNSSRYCYND